MVQLIDKPSIFAAKKTNSSRGFSRNTEKQNSTNGRKFGEKVSVDA